VAVDAQAADPAIGGLGLGAGADADPGADRAEAEAEPAAGQGRGCCNKKEGGGTVRHRGGSHGNGM
jgi:hypothetical protein